MSNSDQNTQASNGTSTAWQIVGRLITAAIVLAITAFFTPGFNISNFWSLAIAAIVLTILDYLVSKFTGIQASPFGKGFVGFVLSVIVYMQSNTLLQDIVFLGCLQLLVLLFTVL